jgi:hypothetical protein
LQDHGSASPKHLRNRSLVFLIEFFSHSSDLPAFERLFVEERRRLKIIPNAFGERAFLYFKFVTWKFLSLSATALIGPG